MSTRGSYNHQPYPAAPRPVGGGRGGHGGGGRGWRENHGQGGRDDTGRLGAMLVKTNIFKLKFTADPGTEWCHYEITITPKADVKDKDRDVPPQDIQDISETSIQRFQENVANDGSTPLTRQILLGFTKQMWDNRHVLATDQSRIGVSPKPLPDGPYFVKVDRRLFKIDLKLLRTIPMGAWTTTPRTQEEMVAARTIGQCLGIIFKEAMSRHCIAVGKNPDTFFLPEEQQRSFIPHVFKRYYENPPSAIAPFIGLSHSVRYHGGNSEFRITINNRIDWLYRGNRPGCTTEPQDIPLLDAAKSTIAGIRVNLDNKIEDPRLRKHIEGTLAKLTFKVKYSKGERWVNETLAKGKDQRYTEKYRNFRKPQVRMASRRRDNDEELPRIKWACDEETFLKDGQSYDVAQYYMRFYDINLRYPHLPIIGTKRGYFPCELCYQELAKAPVGSDPDKVKQVLDYHDQNAGGNRIAHIQNVMKETYVKGEKMSLEALMEKFAAKLILEPLTIQAQNLEAPALTFKNSIEKQTGSGSWNLRGKEFWSAAQLTSFVVVDLCNQSRRSDSRELFLDLFRSMKQHGIEILNDGERRLPELIVQGEANSPDQLMELLVKAKKRARDTYTQNTYLFYTLVMTPKGDLEYCWVQRDTSGKLSAIPLQKGITTHTITNAENGLSVDARIQFRFSGNGGYTDPGDVGGDSKWDTVNEMLAIANDSSHNKFVEELIENYCFSVEGHGLVSMDEISMVRANFELPEFRVECPALIFVYLPDHTDLYHGVKALTDLNIDVNTQCLVRKTVDRQRNRGQYFSNLALKINTKLYCSANGASAWDIQTDAIRWLKEVHTIVLGYSMSHGRLGGRAVTVVGGCVCLNSPIQTSQTAKMFYSDHKSDVVDDQTLKSLIDELMVSFIRHCAGMPRRMIIFRDGGSEGMFNSILDQELSAIRQAVNSIAVRERQAERGSKEYCPDKCESGHCPSCRTTITLVVANKDHNLRIVPEHASGRSGSKANVPSGTLVQDEFGESTIGDRIKNAGDDESFEFLLTPQGGLKGTSKPMLYHCIKNENRTGCTRYPPLSKNILHGLIYEMSFQYGTASKSPRKIPLLLYSEKIANRVVKYGGYLHVLFDDVEEGSSQGRRMLFDEAEDGSQQCKRIDNSGRIHSGGIFGSTYGVYDNRFEEGMKTPFRPHML